MRKLPENPFAVFGKRRASREQHEEHDEEEVVVARSRRAQANPAPAKQVKPAKPVAVKAAKTVAARTPVTTPAPAKAPAQVSTKPAAVQKSRTRKTTSVVKNPSNSSTASSPSSVFSSPSSAYSSLLSPSSTPASTPSQQKNKIVPAIRAAAQQRLDRGQARTIEQASALELLSRIVGKNITMNDIEKERQAVTSSFALFSPPSELIALFDLASRFVESHQFYSRAI